MFKRFYHSLRGFNAGLRYNSTYFVIQNYSFLFFSENSDCMMVSSLNIALGSTEYSCTYRLSSACFKIIHLLEDLFEALDSISLCSYLIDLYFKHKSISNMLQNLTEITYSVICTPITM